MKLLESDIKEFQKLCKKHFGEDVNENDARRELTFLVRQMEILHQPITREQFNSYLELYIREIQEHGRPDYN